MRHDAGSMVIPTRPFIMYSIFYTSTAMKIIVKFGFKQNRHCLPVVDALICLNKN
jgi:hypothetical protein